jgi:NAD(P)-dependent dehydrogenase (short-subunit alcohol dehydrogenase family)
VNKARITLTPTQFDDITEEQFERVININMSGIYDAIRMLFPRRFPTILHGMFECMTFK